VVAYPVIALSEYWKAMQVIAMKTGEYIKALRPALDGSVAMTVAVLALQRFLPAGVSPWVRLISQIAAGGTAYVSVVVALHRARAQHFFQLAKRARGQKAAVALTP
jgi:hypothetical protein